jgi:hypothetical protein
MSNSNLSRTYYDLYGSYLSAALAYPTTNMWTNGDNQAERFLSHLMKSRKSQKIRKSYLRDEMDYTRWVI